MMQSLNENISVIAILIGAIGTLWVAFRIEYNARIKAIEAAKLEIITAKQQEIDHYRSIQNVLHSRIEELEKERFKMFAEMKVTFDAAIDAIRLLDSGRK